jgi:hypothetical protein
VCARPLAQRAAPAMGECPQRPSRVGLVARIVHCAEERTVLDEAAAAPPPRPARVAARQGLPLAAGCWLLAAGDTTHARPLRAQANCCCSAGLRTLAVVASPEPDRQPGAPHDAPSPLAPPRPSGLSLFTMPSHSTLTSREALPIRSTASISQQRLVVATTPPRAVAKPPARGACPQACTVAVTSYAPASASRKPQLGLDSLPSVIAMGQIFVAGRAMPAVSLQNMPLQLALWTETGKALLRSTARLILLAGSQQPSRQGCQHEALGHACWQDWQMHASSPNYLGRR